MPAAPATPPTLTGVGVGPGDPELVTVKAVRVLAAADTILVPDPDTGATEVGRAEQVVLHACPEAAGRIVRVPFSMAQRSGVGTKRRQSWEASAQAALDAYAGAARSVAFATVGDPSVYSTFSYLAAHVRDALPDVVVEVVPGITAMQALAAAGRVPLVEAQELLTLVPVTAGLETLARALELSDTVVAYKGGRHLHEVQRLVRERRPDATAVIGVNVGLPGEQLMPLAELDADRAPYFSTVLVAPTRTATGGRL